MTAPQCNPINPVEEALALKLPRWKESLPTGDSLAAALLGCALENNKLDLDYSDPDQHRDMVENEIRTLILSRPVSANRVMEWAFRQTEEWSGESTQDRERDRCERLAQNLQRLTEQGTEWDVAQFLLDTLMSAISMSKEPPPLDRE